MNSIELKTQSIVECMERNMYEKLQYIPSKISTMSVNKIGETSVVNSGLRSDTFNTAYGGKVTLRLANEVMSYYLNEKMPIAWWIGPSSNKGKNFEINMKEAGFVYDETCEGMYSDLHATSIDKYELSDELSIRKCKAAQDFVDFGEVLSSVWNPADEHVKIFYRKLQSIPDNKRNSLDLFVGYVADKPVSTAALFLTDVAGIYDVSTCPSMQKRGYGSAMFYTVLKSAKNRNIRYSVLEASSDGVNIYKRFGFEKICEFNIWSNKDKLWKLKGC